MQDDIPFSRDFDAAPGQAERISPLVRRVVAPNPSPFTFKGTCTYIVGHGEVAVIDPGPADEAHIAAIRAALKGERITHILVTHTHRDHSPGAALLKQECDAAIYAYETNAGADERADVSGGVKLDAAIDHDFSPDVAVRHGDLIEHEEWAMECVFTPGHMSNHMCFALGAEGALFSGDHVMAWATSVIAPPDGDMADYMASLKLLTGREEQVFWPGHGGPVTSPRRFVRAFIAHRKMREAAILKRLRTGDRQIADMIPHIYGNLDPRLIAAASLSVLAHLEDLVRRGKVAVEGPLATSARFAPA